LAQGTARDRSCELVMQVGMIYNTKFRMFAINLRGNSESLNSNWK
jgi:hypothetical protein